MYCAIHKRNKKERKYKSINKKCKDGFPKLGMPRYNAEYPG